MDPATEFARTGEAAVRDAGLCLKANLGGRVEASYKGGRRPGDVLDRDDPARVIGRLREPLLRPIENEREGYVPNVVYSCGSLVHGDLLVIPYAMSDYATTFATVPLAAVLAAME